MIGILKNSRLLRDLALFLGVVTWCAFAWNRFFEGAEQKNAHGIKVPSRSIASLDQPLPVQDTVTKRFALTCASLGEKNQVTEARILQVEWSPCSGTKNWRISKIDPTTENILLFEREGKVYSPYLPLQQGNNRFELSWAEGKNLKSMTVNFTRN